MIIIKFPNHLFPFTVQRQFALLCCFAQVLYKAMLIEIGEKKLNLSIGVFQAGLLKLFTKVNGVVVPVKKSVGEMVDVFAKYGNFEMNIVIADGRVGKLTKNGYQDGIIGLMSKNEIDITWIPLPMDTPNISGVFSHVVYEDEYRLASYYRPTTSISQDVIHTFTLFDPKIWFIALLLTYAIECLLNFKDTSFSSIVSLLISCTQRFPSLFFRQYFAKRSVAQSISILGLLFLSIIFGASFNKDMIIGTSRETVNTLRDVVNQRKTPIFIDASSKYELFQLGETKDYADVYKLAIEKGSIQEYSADSISAFSRITPGHAIFASSRIRRVINLAHNLFRTDKSDILHWSDQTYHKVHQAYIITASPFKVEVRKRLMHLTGQFQQSDFIDRIQSKSVIEVSKDLGVSLYEVYTAFDERNNEQTKNLHLYSPLSIVGFQSVRRYYCIFIKLSISIFTIEFILGKIFSNTRTKNFFFCRSRPFKL